MTIQHDEHEESSSDYDASFIGTDLVFGRTVFPVPLPNKHHYQFAEHSFVGDAIKLTLTSGGKVDAIGHKFHLKNGLAITYGQINGLAGDLYGTENPICTGDGAEEQSRRFIAAYNTLADPSKRQPEEAQDLLAILQTEVDGVNDALKHDQDPSIVYGHMHDIHGKLYFRTIGRTTFPTYLGLAQKNWDHFGADARKAYNAGHATALQAAAKGELEWAYTLNAFADHYLEDSFSAGHLRTPRRSLDPDGKKLPGLCCKYMHDEDNAIGLSVKNPSGDSWVAFGDKRALDKVNAEGRKRCVAAVQASADEIYEAYKTKAVPDSSQYKAWTHAPTLESARAPQLLAPLFTFDGKRRETIKNRRAHEFTSDWTYAFTLAEIKWSGWFNYPITIDGPSKVVPRTALAVTRSGIESSRVYYQQPTQRVLESAFIEGTCTGGAEGLSLFDAAPFTPLAAVNWQNGDEVRVFYVDKDFTLQEHCYSSSRGSWLPGELSQLKIQVAANTSIAALRYSNDDGVHIRLYCQEFDSNAIKEFWNNTGSWCRGATLPDALSGTGIGGIAYYDEGLKLRVYYQEDNLDIREHRFNDGEWIAGDFNPGKAPGRTAITAIGWSNQKAGEVQVFWMTRDNEIVQMRNTSGQWGFTNKVVGPLMSGARFAVAQWEDGKSVRVYYQSEDDSLLEVCNDDGSAWYSGTTIAYGKFDEA